MIYTLFAAIGLVLLGSLSPLLTFTALFQQKEWRLDRLREHLRRDGWFIQLFGKIRPAIVLLYLLLYIPSFIQMRIGGENGPSYMIALNIITFTISTLMLVGALNIIQLSLRKQRMPVWTSKAILLVGIAFLINAFIAAYGFRTEAISLIFPAPLLFVMQPIVGLLAWALLKPIDYVLKKRVMDRAMKLRSQMKDATVIGIAGSVGKTTVKELIAHLVQDLHPLVTPAHVNTEMGVAQWLLRQPVTRDENNNSRERNSEGHSKLEARNSKLFVIEMGAYRKGEIALLAKIAQPTIGVMTALGSDHLALFGSEEAIVEANGELIAALPSTGHAFFYGENAGCQQLAKHSPCSVTLTGSDDLKPTPIKETASGLEFSIFNFQFSIPLHGTHNIHNALLGIAVAHHLGIKDERIAELLKTFRSQAHTFDVTTERGVLLLDDTYNISPLSFHAALDWAGKQSERPRVLLTSGLQETGKDEDRFLTELGTKASKSVERVIFTNAHGSDIFAKAFGKPVEILNTHTERVAAGSTLLAVGRMPLSTIHRLLPLS